MSWSTMFRHTLAALLALILCFSCAVSIGEESAEIVVIRSAGTMGETEALMATLYALTYQQVPFRVITTDEMAVIGPSTLVIVCLDPLDTLPESMVERFSDAHKILVVGTGGMDQLASNIKVLSGTMMLYCYSEDGHPSTSLIASQTLKVNVDATFQSSHTIDCYGISYPLYTTQEALTHFAYLDQSPSLYAVFSTLLSEWLEQLAPHFVNETYVVLDNIYPFEDPETILALVDLLNEEGIPYAMSLMPLYYNADFPSFQALCTVLEYAQSQGAFMILHTPHVRLHEVKTTDFLTYMDQAYQVYLDNELYPLALLMPQSYAFTEIGDALLAQASTLFLYDNGGSASLSGVTQSIAYGDTHRIISQAYQSTLTYPPSFPKALYLDVHLPYETIKAQIDNLKTNHVSITDLTTLNHTLSFHENNVSLTNGRLIVNGEETWLHYEPYVPQEDYRYDKGLVQYLTHQIQFSNQVLLTFVTLSSIMFAIMIFILRRSMRWQMLKRKKLPPTKED